MKVLCKLTHKWVEKSRITWKNDGASEGSCVEKCARCGKQRRRFLEPAA